jgi:hypothetical protein
VRRLLGSLLLVLLALPAAGCVQADETWTIDEKGGGTWTLVLRWNADLWHRAEGIVGRPVLDRISGNGFPLRPSDWQDAVEGIEGLALEEAKEEEVEGGSRELTVRLRFRSLEDLLRCEVLDARRVVVRPGAKEEGSDAIPPASFETALDREIPLLDALAGLATARQRVEEGTGDEGGSGADASPLAALGVSEADATLLARMLAPALAQVRVGIRVQVPGEVLRVGDSAPRGRPQEAAATFDFLHLRRSAPRLLRFEWQPRSFDVVPSVGHP